MDFISVGTLLSGQRHFAIPDYQREYSWTKAENDTLWEDIKDLVLNDSAEHFLGAIVTVRYSEEDNSLSIRQPKQFSISDDKVVHLLDGQQRITSLVLLIAAFKKVVQTLEELDDTSRTILSSQLDDLIFDKYKIHAGEKSPRLFLKEQSGKYFCKEILGLTCGDPDYRFKSVKNMNEAFSRYQSQIEELITDECGSGKRFLMPSQCLEMLLSAITIRAQLVEIRCGDSMNEFQVFESLNGKGLGLTAVDRIRNIYMSKARLANVDGAIRWNAITAAIDDNDAPLLHFFISFFFYEHNQRVSKVALPNKFKDLLRLTEDFETIDANLAASANLYGKLRTADSQNEAAKNTLNEVAEMGQEQIYVPLFAAAKKYGIDSDKFAEVAAALLVYMVRFIVCGQPTNSLDSEFSSFITLMKTSGHGDVLKKIRQKQECDTEFLRYFKRYCTHNATFAKYLLRKMEVHLRMANGDGNSVPENLSLEHIIPQKIDFADWYGGEEHIPDPAERASFKEDVIFSIGNMALLTKCDNTTASNKNFSAKVDVYKNGSRRVKDYGKPYNTHQLIKNVVDKYDVFEREQVLQRAEEFANYALLIWPE